jgi:hypothetical protein
MRSNDIMQDVSFNWSRASLCQNGECVEIAAHGEMVIMRSSAHPNAGYVYFSQKEFGSFLAAAKAGEFDMAR